MQPKLFGKKKTNCSTQKNFFYLKSWSIVQVLNKLLGTASDMSKCQAWKNIFKMNRCDERIKTEETKYADWSRCNLKEKKEVSQ